MNLDKICYWFDMCPLKKFYEQGRIDKRWIEDYCFGDFSKCVRRKMEEKNLYHPDNMMPDGTVYLWACAFMEIGQFVGNRPCFE